MLIFLAHELIVAVTPNKIDFGDLVAGSRWIKKYPLKNHVVFAFLYSLSFLTMFMLTY
jgi:hypothetical protein